MVKDSETIPIQCPCGSDTFLLTEHGSVTELFSTEHPDPNTIKHLTLKSKLFCTECSKPSKIFETDLLFLNNDYNGLNGNNNLNNNGRFVGIVKLICWDIFFSEIIICNYI